MNAFAIEIKGGTALEAALERAPLAIFRHVDRQLSHAALEIAREMRRLAPKAVSTLINSISVTRLKLMAFSIGPHVNYARFVEEGRAPGGRMPPLESIQDWVKTKGLLGNSPEPRALRGTAWAIARHIQIHGTKPQPFARPVAKDPKMHARVQELVDEGVRNGLREAGL